MDTEVLHVHPAMYRVAVQRYETEHVVSRTENGSLESFPNPHHGKFKIVEDSSLRVQDYRMVDGTVGSWPRIACPCQVACEVVDAEDPTVDGPYIVLNGRTIAKFTGTAEERAEGVRLWQEALKELRR